MPIETFYISSKSTHNKQQAGIKSICTKEGGGGGVKRGLDHLLLKFEHIFVAVITFPPFLLCRYFCAISVTAPPSNRRNSGMLHGKNNFSMLYHRLAF